jgi:hypothetical protein
MTVEILNWLGPPREGDWGGMRKTGRDEPIVSICMETMQGNSLKLGFSLYLLVFSST